MYGHMALAKALYGLIFVVFVLLFMAELMYEYGYGYRIDTLLLYVA